MIWLRNTGGRGAGNPADKLTIATHLQSDFRPEYGNTLTTAYSMLAAGKIEDVDDFRSHLEINGEWRMQRVQDALTGGELVLG